MSYVTTNLKGLVENGSLEGIDEACEVIARALVSRVKIEDDFLYELSADCLSKAGADENIENSAEEWARLIFTCVDYIERKEVLLPDGRRATKQGWDYSRCEKDSIHANVAQPVIDRLESYIRGLTSEEPSTDPDKSPTEFDRIYDATIEKALVEFFRVKEVNSEPE